MFFLNGNCAYVVNLEYFFNAKKKISLFFSSLKNMSLFLVWYKTYTLFSLLLLNNSVSGITGFFFKYVLPNIFLFLIINIFKN